MKIAVSCESTADLSKELIEKYKLNVIPFTVLIGDDSFLDGEIDNSLIFDYVNKTHHLPKTSAVNEFQYEAMFNKLKMEYDAVIHIASSSYMSSAYQNAKLVGDRIENIHVVDSESLSTGIALLAIYASELIDENKWTIEEIIQKIEKRKKFVLVSLLATRIDYLFKGGRCSMLQLLGANLLRLKPQIYMKDGKTVAGHKYRGNFETATMKYVADTLEQFNNYDKKHVFISYTSAPLEIVEKVKKIFEDLKFENIHITQTGATIACHCGDNCIGILYFYDGGDK